MLRSGRDNLPRRGSPGNKGAGHLVSEPKEGRRGAQGASRRHMAEQNHVERADSNRPQVSEPKAYREQSHRGANRQEPASPWERAEGERIASRARKRLPQDFSYTSLPSLGAGGLPRPPAGHPRPCAVHRSPSTIPPTTRLPPLGHPRSPSVSPPAGHPRPPLGHPPPTTTSAPTSSPPLHPPTGHHERRHPRNLPRVRAGVWPSSCIHRRNRLGAWPATRVTSPLPGLLHMT